jgi:UDP-glucose 4-epimerase
MKICVTGGAGFIGSHVAEAYINAGHNVVILDDLSTGKEENIPQGATFIRCDITTDDLRSIFERERFDVLNHHAANMELRVSVEDPAHDARINILGTVRLLDAAHRTGVEHIVFASTGGGIYGVQQYYPADEHHPVRPLSPYGVAKRSVELYLDYYRAVYRLTSTALRYTNVYGPRQNPFGEAGVIAIFLERMLTGRASIINGDGEQRRDYVHVRDVARANVLATERRLDGVFNVSTGIETSVNRIVELLQTSLGSTGTVEHGPPKTGDLDRNVCSAAALEAETGWRPTVDVENGIAETASWFRVRH